LEDGLQLDTECDGHPRRLDEYVQAWQIRMWKHGFLGFSKGKDAYSRTKAFGDHKHIDLAVKLVIFKCFCPLDSQAFSYFDPTAL
jgi:hypothetical protein